MHTYTPHDESSHDRDRRLHNARANAMRARLSESGDNLARAVGGDPADRTFRIIRMDTPPALWAVWGDNPETIEYRKTLRGLGAPEGENILPDEECGDA